MTWRTRPPARSHHDEGWAADANRVPEFGPGGEFYAAPGLAPGVPGADEDGPPRGAVIRWFANDDRGAMYRPVDDLRRRQRQEWWALALLLLAVALLFVALRWNARAAIDTAERERLDGQAKAVQRILARQFETAYTALVGVREDKASWAAGDLATSASRRLKSLADAIPGVTVLALLDARGKVLASSRLTLIGADRATRLPANADAGTLYVTPPASDGNGALAIDFVLPVPGSDGMGAIVATLDAEYFSVVLRSVLYAPDMRASVAHGDGGVLLYEPPRPIKEGLNVAQPGSFFVRHRDSGRDANLISGVTAITGEARLAALRTLKPAGVPMDSPLVLSISRDLDEVFAPWRQQTLSNSGLFALSAVGTVLALALLQRRQRELQALQREAGVREHAEGERLALALRGADLALWDHDMQSGRGTVNARWNEMLGYQPGDITVAEEGWRDLVHPDDQPRVFAALQAHVEGHSEGYEAVYRMRHRDGHWIWILDRGKVLERAADGKPLRMVGTHMDISQRMEAEQALRRSEESLAITLHSIGDAVIATDADGRITRLNATAAQLTGWPEAEAVGQPLSAVFRIVNPHTGLVVDNPVQAVLARGEVVGLANDTQLVARDGAEYQIADSAAPIRTPEGQVIGVVLVFSNVSERYRAQRALHDRERQLSMIADMLPGPVSRASADGRYLFANAAYKSWFGVEPEAAVGRTAREVLGERRYRAIEPYVQRVLAGETVQGEYPMYTEHAGRRHALVTLTPDRDPSGRVCGHFTVVIDITERKRAEDALRSSEAKTRALVDSLLIGVFVHAPSTEVLEANPAGCRLLGLTLDQVRGKTAVDPAWHFVEEDGTPMLPARYPVAQVAASGRPLSDLVLGVVRSSGEPPLWVLCNAFATRHTDGSVEQILVTVFDITERRQAEFERQALERQLRESQRMESIGTLAGGIAHDFNNILAAILGNVALAREEAGAGHPAQVSLEQIHKAGLRARSLVQQILAFSRRDPGALEVQPLRTVVEETLGLLRATLPAKVRLEARLPEAPVPVRADATQLQQVMMNLATNAWHALAENGGWIEIGIERISAEAAARLPEPGLPPGPAAHLWVRDNGSGMDAATCARIFDPFFTTKPVGQGTGLGLSVVHGIVRAHQGTVVVDSAPGAGSTFHLYFPSPDVASGIGPAAGPGPADAAGGGQHVLYVDDDEVMVVMAERLLQRAGYRVSTAASAAEALAQLDAAPAGVDIVVTDFNMPEQSGIELAQRIAMLRPSLPVVLSSGLVSETLREQARQVGVRAVLKKENSFEELAATVGRLLAS